MPGIRTPFERATESRLTRAARRAAFSRVSAAWRVGRSASARTACLAPAELKIQRRMTSASVATTHQIARDGQRHPRHEQRPPPTRGQSTSLGRDDVQPRPRVTQDLIDAGRPEHEVERAAEYGR